jgi:hypothetical protein
MSAIDLDASYPSVGWPTPLGQEATTSVGSECALLGTIGVPCILGFAKYLVLCEPSRGQRVYLSEHTSHIQQTSE